MTITYDNAERMLYAVIDDVRVKAPSLRCIVFRLSKIPHRPHNALEKLVSAAEEVMDDISTHFFVCEDGDVFALSRHVTSKLFEKLLSHPTLKNWLASPHGEPAHLFEVGVDGDIIQTLLQPKIDIKDHSLREQQRKKEEAERALAHMMAERVLNPDISQEKVETISLRREQRTKPHILVVEDDPFTQKLVGRALGTLYDVFYADSAAQAVQLYVRHAPDILFLDIGLPDVDGHTVLQKILDMDRHAYVVMLSGNGNKENVIKAVQNGAKGFVGKPFTKIRLEEYIQKSPFMCQKLQKEAV